MKTRVSNVQVGGIPRVSMMYVTAVPAFPPTHEPRRIGRAALVNTALISLRTLEQTLASQALSTTRTPPPSSAKKISTKKPRTLPPNELHCGAGRG